MPLRDGVFKMGRKWFAYTYGQLLASFKTKREAKACYDAFNAAWDYDAA